MDGGAWWATVHRVTKSRTRLSDFTFTFRKTHTDPKGQKAGWLRGWGTRPEEETGKITVRRHFWEVAATQPSDANGFRNIYVGILFTYIHVLKYMHGYIYIYIYKSNSLLAQMAKNLPANAGEAGSIPGSGRLPWRREWQPTPVFLGFPGGSDGKESPCNAGDLGSIPGSGRSPGGGNNNPL